MVLLLGMVLGVAYFVSGSGSPDSQAGDSQAGDGGSLISTDSSGDSSVSGPPSNGVGFVGLSPDDDIATKVAAALEALVPTPTPEPTEDPRDRFRSSLFGHGGDDVPTPLAPDPLGSPLLRNTHLSEPDLRALETTGQLLWPVIEAYLRMREVLAVDFWNLTWTGVEERYLLVQALISEPPDFQAVRPGGTSELVSSFLDHLGDSAFEVHGAGLSLGLLVDVFAEAGVEHLVELPPEAREVARGHYSAIDSQLQGFSSGMSEYGCSICGELFRSPVPGP